ncbi:MAG: arginase family protein, partial [Acidobacteria bacterium]|nr:arginase family protein [Acidobacteriota bacterium]
ICFDVVEVNPERDESGITAAAAGKLAMEVMGKILYERRKK